MALPVEWSVLCHDGSFPCLTLLDKLAFLQPTGKKSHRAVWHLHFVF